MYNAIFSLQRVYTGYRIVHIAIMYVITIYYIHVDIMLTSAFTDIYI